MDKTAVAAILEEIGTLLELKGENPFRANAYRNAARTLEQLETNLADVVKAGQLDSIPGIGETLRDKITTLVTTGQLPFYDDLKKQFPPGLLDMLRIQGMGPKKVKALWDQLGVDDLAKLKQACEAGQVAGLKGCPGIERIEVCGSYRRRKEVIGDIDILVSADDAAPIMERFVALPGVVQVLGQGPTKSSILVGDGAGRDRVTLNADLRVVTDEQFPFALHYFTGSKDHNIAMRARAQKYGLKLNEYELAGDKKKVKCQTEADIFKALDLDYIPPELRENTGEIEAAEKQHLPHLLDADAIQGVFHCHTTWSDGAATLEEMAAAAKALGLHYLGIADHSQSLTVANGLSPERVRQQQQDIDALNARLKGIHLFKGIECDILPDGSLDYTDDVLASFDYVVASVHSHFNQTEAEMTQRIVKAVSHPRVTMLGHATGRLLLRRDSYKVDLEAVLQAAKAHGTMVEINAHPQRLDLDWVHCKRAKALGVQLVINPDAHATREIALYRFGVDVARRAWLEKKDVFNTQTLAQVKKGLKK